MRLLACPSGPSFPLCVPSYSSFPFPYSFSTSFIMLAQGRRRRRRERFHLLLCRHFLRKQGGDAPAHNENFPNTEFRSKSSFFPLKDSLPLTLRDTLWLWGSSSETMTAGVHTYRICWAWLRRWQAHEDQLKISFFPSPFLLPLV